MVSSCILAQQLRRETVRSPSPLIFKVLIKPQAVPLEALAVFIVDIADKVLLHCDITLAGGVRSADLKINKTQERKSQLTSKNSA